MNPAALLEKGLAAHRAGDLENAAAAYRQILQHNPEHPDALHLLGLVVQKGGNHAEAIGLFSQAAKANPKLAKAHLQRGFSLNALGQTEDATAAFKAAIAAESKLAEAHHQLGNTLRTLNRLPEALASLREATRLAPKDVVFWLSLGLAAMHGQQLDEAVESFQHAVKLNPSLPEAREILAQALMAQQRTDEARQQLNEALRLRPNFAEAHHDLGRLCVEEGLLAEAATHYRNRVEAVRGEMTEEDLGLSQSTRERLADEVDTIIHCAASVSFDLPIEEARAINVGGTRRMIDFAKLVQGRGGLKKYSQVSTAYVAGTYEGRFTEDDLDVGQGFRNSYEQSKFESEQLVRTEGKDLPWMILRPSIIVGDRASGWTSAFNVMYWPLRALSTGLFKAVPAMPESPLDIVSIDYVADAIIELSDGPAEPQQTFHLTAGTDASSWGEIVSMASRYFRRPEPKAVPPSEFVADHTTLSDMAVAASRIYFPYFSISTVFDNARTRARLAQAGIHSSPLGDYLDRLLDFATRSRWGKRPIGRAAAQTH